MIKRLTAIGNSHGIIIEKAILELLDIDRDTELEMKTDGGSADYSAHKSEQERDGSEIFSSHDENPCPDVEETGGVTIMATEFLDLDIVLTIHAEQLEIFGGSPGLRDQGLLESALAQPESTFDGKFVHVDLFEMAAAYAFHLAQNQPFIDGNKRTGLLCALVFLDLNGFPIDTPNPRLEEAMLDIAEHKQDKSDLAILFRELSQRDNKDNVGS